MRVRRSIISRSMAVAVAFVSGLITMVGGSSMAGHYRESLCAAQCGRLRYGAALLGRRVESC